MAWSGGDSPQIDSATADMAASRRRIHAGHVLGGTFFLAPTIAAVAPLGLAVLFSVAVVAALGLCAYQRLWLRVSRGVLVFGVSLVAWAALTGLWSVAREETWHFLPRFAVEIAAGVCLLSLALSLSARERGVLEKLLIYGFICGAILFAIEIATEGGISLGLRVLVTGQHRQLELGALNRGAVALAILCFPAALAMRRRCGNVAALVTLLAGFSLTLNVQGSKAALGVAVGLTTMAAAFALRHRAPPLLAAALVASIAAAPFYSAALTAIPGPWTTSEAPSIKHRTLIWKFVTTQIAERPVLGWGFNTSRAFPGGKAGPNLGTELLPLHPHNVPLQLWLELGGIGALLVAIGLAVAVLKLGRRFIDPAERAFALGTVTTIELMAAVGYGAWQTWWLASLGLAATALAALGRSEPATGSGVSSL
jgi:O-antigen ligase